MNIENLSPFIITSNEKTNVQRSIRKFQYFFKIKVRSTLQKFLIIHIYYVQECYRFCVSL